MDKSHINPWIDFAAKLFHWLSTFCFGIVACSILSAYFLTDMWWSIIDANIENVPPDVNLASLVLLPFVPALLACPVAIFLFGLGIILRILCKSAIFDLAARINIYSMSLPVFTVLLLVKFT